MTLRYLLDTDIVSAGMASKPDRRLVGRVERHAHEAAIGTPIWHELVYGVERLREDRRREKLVAYLAEVVGLFPVLAYDEAAAAWHARERGRLMAIGMPPPFADSQIASIAATNDLILVTVNAKHFEPFVDLAIEDWTQSRGAG